ncbi:MAG: hypothetical protein NC548_05880 [Lachnospiraceae bacterium]|nr:hypothetical protein [Lachnospiraceae bacterium]
MSKRTSVCGMNDGFSALFDLGCRQFSVRTVTGRQPLPPITHEVSFWVPVQVGGGKMG